MRLSKLLAVSVFILCITQPSTLTAQQRSSLGCSTAYYMLTNSIPRSCNAALNRITALLTNSNQVIDSGDICTSYCITPLKQAALECRAINDIYTAVSLRCCWNERGQQCFSLAGHASLADIESECGHYLNNSSADNCSTTCSAAMTTAANTLGCCLPALLTGSDSERFLEPTLWQQCNETPGPPCTQCSVATSPSSGWGILLAIAALCGTLSL